MIPESPVAAVKHELRDIPVRPFVWGAAVFVAGVALVFVVCLIVFRMFVAPAGSDSRSFPSAPRLAIDPGLEYQLLRQEEDRKLKSYEWVDRESGKVRIPVERAIEIQLQRGFPTRQEFKK